MIQWADVTAIASELSGLGPEAQEMILAFVNESLEPDKLGGEGSARLRLARVYLAAHLGALVGAGSNGPVTMEQEGPVMHQYARGVGLDETSYGRRYREIVRTSAARLPWVL